MSKEKLWFVSFAFYKDGEQGFGYDTLTTEKDLNTMNGLRDTIEEIKNESGVDMVIILFFKEMIL